MRATFSCATQRHIELRAHGPNTSMQIYDVSVALSHTTPTYPGDPKIEITDWSTLAGGDAANVSLLHMGAHSGTHVDAPVHFIPGGETVESLALSVLIGEAEVIEVSPDFLVIDEDFVSNKCTGSSERVLFKTRNSDFWNSPEDGFRVDYTYIEAAAARRLVALGAKLVGIDYLSIEPYQSNTFATHHIFLSNGVVVLEGLDLRSVSAGHYELICLPLKIAGGSGDGAPARTILRTLK
jgi:arylformamidase